MRYSGRFIFLLCVLLARSAIAMPGDMPFTKFYACIFQKITALPAGGNAVKRLSDKEMVGLFVKLKKQGIELPYHIVNDTLIPNNGYRAKVYQGDFSNQGIKEYLFDTESGSGHYDTITDVYRFSDDLFQPVNFEKVIAENGLQREGGFYSHLAEPFAYVLQGKTYIRFMDFPVSHTNYDPKLLHVYIYLWKGDKFTKIIQLNGAHYGC